MIFIPYVLGTSFHAMLCHQAWNSLFVTFFQEGDCKAWEIVDNSNSTKGSTLAKKSFFYVFHAWTMWLWDVCSWVSEVEGQHEYLFLWGCWCGYFWSCIWWVGYGSCFHIGLKGSLIMLLKLGDWDSMAAWKVFHNGKGFHVS